MGRAVGSRARYVPSRLCLAIRTMATGIVMHQAATRSYIVTTESGLNKAFEEWTTVDLKIMLRYKMKSGYTSTAYLAGPAWKA